MKILVAEDDLGSLHMLERTLQNQGYEVIPTKHGQEAWRVLQSKEPPSIAILDWMMPEMDGLELIGKIRASKLPNYIYIILLTAKSQKHEIIQGIEAGADDYLTKPFDRNELLARLRTGKRIVGLEKKLARNNKQLKAVNQDLMERNSQIKRDLEAAAEIQKTLLPYKTPKAPGVNIEWMYKPCDELAGDILNVFWLDEKHLGIYLIDVSGHGVSAALLAVALNRILIPVPGQSTLVLKKSGNSTQYKIVPPAKVAEQLNQRFMIDECGQYFTLVYGVLNIETRNLKFISAGHPTSLHIANSRGISTFDNTCLPVGFLENETYIETSVCFGAGDRFFLYSDGIIDAINCKNHQFGIERLKKVLWRNKNTDLKNCLQAVNRAVKKWSDGGVTDDISMLALEICD